MASVLFLGGYHFWGLNADWFGPFVLLGKAGVWCFLMIWFRWTWPRLREDQLQSLAWRWLVPLALANIAVTAIFKVALMSAPASRPRSRPLGGARAGPVQGHVAHPEDPVQQAGHGHVPGGEGDPRARGPAGSSPSTPTPAPSACCAPASAPTGASTSRGTRSSSLRPSRAAGRARARCSTASTSTSGCACTAASASRSAPSMPCSGRRSTSTPARTLAGLLHDKERLAQWLGTVPEPPALEGSES